MRPLIRHRLRFAAAIACGAARLAGAQAGASADTTGGKSNVLPVVEIASFLTLLSVYDRVAYANEMQDGKRVYSATFASAYTTRIRSTSINSSIRIRVR
jgi:hypothetical protein